MDAETKKLLEDVRLSFNNGGKSFFMNIIQSVIIAIVIAVPTVIIIINQFENRMIESERELKEYAFKVDYNFSIVEDKDGTLHFIDLSKKEKEQD